MLADHAHHSAVGVRLDHCISRAPIPPRPGGARADLPGGLHPGCVDTERATMSQFAGTGRWLLRALAREQAEQYLAFGVEPSSLLHPAHASVFLGGSVSVSHLGSHNLDDLSVVHFPSRGVARSETLNAASDVAGTHWQVSVTHTDQSRIANGPECRADGRCSDHVSRLHSFLEGSSQSNFHRAHRSSVPHAPYGPIRMVGHFGTFEGGGRTYWLAHRRNCGEPHSRQHREERPSRRCGRLPLPAQDHVDRMPGAKIKLLCRPPGSHQFPRGCLRMSRRRR